MTTPIDERVKGGARSTRFWLLLVAGLAVVVAAAAVALGVVGGRDSGSLARDPLGSTPAGPGTSTTVSGAVAANETGDFAFGDDQVADGAALACARFKQGATVVEFAAWFEAEVELDGPDQEDLFQVIIIRALTESCPEVVAGD